MNKVPDAPRRALGKGLSALLPARPSPKPTEPLPTPDVPHSAVRLLALDQIDPNPLQPREGFDEAKLLELAESIKANGLIQPLIVQSQGDRFQLVAGERRWRAARLAGLQTVEVIVRDMAADRLLEVALIENIQREDLNAIEIAHAFQRLHSELKLSHDEIGIRTGKDRTTITNLVRLLKLPSPIQHLVAQQKLSMGHARALLGLPSEDLQLAAARQVMVEEMSVRQVERLVQKLIKPAAPAAEPVEKPKQDPNVKAAADELERTLGTRVRIVEQSKNKGTVEIEYYSQDDLDRIYLFIVGDGAGGRS